MSPELRMMINQIQQDLRDHRKETNNAFKEMQQEIKDLQGFKLKTAGIATACSFIIGLAVKIYFN